MDPQRLVESLNASFEAAIAREEDRSASELAFSFMQNRPLRDVLARLGSAQLCLPEGARAPVSVVGRDYLGAGDPLELAVPASRAVLLQAGVGEAPELRHDSLLMVLRSWARLGLKVQLEAPSGSIRGYLEAVGSDHVQVHTPLGWGLVALGCLDAVRVVRGGSRDAP